MLTSPAATSAVALGAGLAAAVAVVTASAARVVASTRAALAHATDDGGADRARAAAAAVPLELLAAAAPIAVAAAVGALLAQGVLARGLWQPTRTVRGAPTTGAEPSTARTRAAEAAIALVRTLALIAVAVAVVVARLPALAELAPRPAGAASALLALAASAAATVAIAAIALAVLEVAWRHHLLARSLAMTTREWRDDAREAIGDPNVRQAQRAAGRDDRAVVAGARALVVGDRLAVAVGWQPGTTPRVVATGRDLASRRLIAAARAAALPIVVDADLAARLAVGAAIPDDALATVAEVLAAAGAAA